MSGYVIANYTVTNKDAYKAYGPAVAPTLRAHGAEILVADFGPEVKEGTPGEVVVVLRFPSKEAALAWYESEEYQAIVHLRTDNAEGFLAICDERVAPS
jgi:uncharacterized protein (DUF1330 family)